VSEREECVLPFVLSSLTPLPFLLLTSFLLFITLHSFSYLSRECSEMKEEERSEVNGVWCVVSLSIKRALHSIPLPFN